MASMIFASASAIVTATIDSLPTSPGYKVGGYS